jgi:hypothetical protein
MAKAQWIAVEVCPHNLEVKIKNARLDFGIFYANNDKDVSISSDIINNITVAAGNSRHLLLVEHQIELQVLKDNSIFMMEIPKS